MKSRKINYEINLQLILIVSIFLAILTTAIVVKKLSPTFSLAQTTVDTTDPTVSIISPKEGEIVSGIVTVEANASDDVGLSKVELYGEGVNSATLLGVFTEPPYKAQWDTTVLQDCLRSLYAYAYDLRGNSATAMIRVNVNRSCSQSTGTSPSPTPNPSSSDTIPPTVLISSPANGSSVEGIVTIIVSASDNKDISQVNIYPEGATPQVFVNAPYTMQWDTTKLSPGTRCIDAYAYDSAGNSATNRSCVTVKDIVPPSVTIITPTDGAILPRNKEFIVKSSATDNYQVNRIVTYVTGPAGYTPFKCISYLANSNCAWRIPNKAKITYTITVTAYDWASNSDSKIISVTVK